MSSCQKHLADGSPLSSLRAPAVLIPFKHIALYLAEKFMDKQDTVVQKPSEIFERFFSITAIIVLNYRDELLNTADPIPDIQNKLTQVCHGFYSLTALVQSSYLCMIIF